VIPLEFLLLFVQGYDSAGFTVPALTAAMTKSAGTVSIPWTVAMRKSGMFYFNISINWLTLGMCREWDSSGCCGAGAR
jgi:hypothetical protein